MADDHEERFRQHEAIQAAFNADVRTILARIETLMTRKLSTGDNGREA